MSQPSPDQVDRRRVHAERMLARAEHRQRQAAKLVQKWKRRVAELERASVESIQARLWTDEQPQSQPEPEIHVP